MGWAGQNWQTFITAPLREHAEREPTHSTGTTDQLAS